MKYVKWCIVSVCVVLIAGCANQQLDKCQKQANALKLELEKTKQQLQEVQQNSNESAVFLMDNVEKCEKQLKELQDKRKKERADLDKLLKAKISDQTKIKQLQEQLAESKAAMTQMAELMKQQENALKSKYQTKIDSLNQQIAALKAKLQNNQPPTGGNMMK